jgi:hypothetical protein
MVGRRTWVGTWRANWRSDQIADIQRLEGELALAKEAVRRFEHRLDIAKRVLTKSVERAGVQARHYATQYV